MADYRTDGFASYYAGTGPVGNYVGTSPGFLSLWDVELDTTFEFGDPINGTETYAGSIEVALVAGGTATLPVGRTAGTNYHYKIYYPEGTSASDYSFPEQVDGTTLNTGDFPTCFLPGTCIATPTGSKYVEDLQIGEPILTATGTSVPVKWIGRQTVSTLFGPAERLMPVRFAAGSLGDGLPHTDLTVTADHGMLVDGVICHAGALVNGTTITRVPLAEMGETYTVYHIETEAHEIILANGAPAETFIDNVSRRAFDNFAEFEALYGDVPEMAELPYPRAMSARQVPGAIRARLAPPKVA